MAENVEYILLLKDRFTANLKNANKSIDQLNKKTEGFRKIASQLTPFLGFAAIGAGIKGVVQLGIEMEQTRVAFATFLKDGDKANKLIAQLNQFANVTPFNNQEVIKAGRVLLAANIPAEKIQQTLRQIGDVSAGANVPLTEMAAIYSKAMNKGRLQAEELNQLAERGVPILQTFSDMFGVTTQEVMKMGSEGKLTSELMNQAFGRMTNEGGIFFNLMEKQSATLGGKISTIQGKFQLLGSQLGEINGVLKSYADRVIRVTDVLLNNQQTIEKGIKIVAKALKLWIAYKTAIFAYTKAVKIATIANNVYRFATIATNKGLKSAIVLTKSFNSAMKANVIGLVVTGLGFLISKLVEMRNKTKDATAAQEDFNKKQDELQKKLNKQRITEFFKRAGFAQQSFVQEVNGMKQYVDYFDKLGSQDFTKIIKTSSLEDLRNMQDIINESMIDLQRIQAVYEGTGFRSAFSSGINNTINSYKMAIGQISKELNKYGESSTIQSTITPDKSAKKLEQTITSAAPKVFNINIAKLIETQEINTTNLKESTGKIKQLITEALLEGLNETQTMVAR